MAAPINIGFIFAIFFLTLGPLKLIPAFCGVALGRDGKTRLGLALKSTALAFGILQAAVGVTFMLRGLVAVFGPPWLSTPL
jgi:multiple antibiotic resistance protein